MATEITKPKIESYDIGRSDETLQLAQDLSRFIRENNLALNLNGKSYVNVEGWQYAGARLGILPVVEALLNVSADGSEIKYQAKVNLLNLRTDQIVGTGFALCSNKENGKKFYQEFAIASMAQTRAIGKAYRNILAWIIRAAGYEATPAEEMDYAGNDNTPPQAAAPAAPAAPAPVAGSPAPEASSAKLRPATAKQKADILLLLSHKAVTADEKDRMVKNINKLDGIRAQQAIQNLKRVISERAVSTKASDAA